MNLNVLYTARFLRCSEIYQNVVNIMLYPLMYLNFGILTALNKIHYPFYWRACVAGDPIYLKRKGSDYC